jgi:diguanylate cyclase (GGDEF)-like protein
MRWHKNTRISFGLRRQESVLGWTLASGVLWLQISDTAAPLGGWGMALVAASCAGWARAYPGSTDFSITLRALILGTALGPWALIRPELTVEFCFWMFASSAFYALLLSKARLGIFILINLLCLVAPIWLQIWPKQQQEVLIQLSGLYCIVILSCARLGQWIRKLDAQASSSLIDPRTRLYNTQGFFNYGQMLLEDTLRAKQEFSLILINCDGLRGITLGTGKQHARLLLKQVIQQVQAVTPKNGIVARTDSNEFSIAIPSVSAKQVHEYISQHLGIPPIFKLGRKSSKTNLAVDVLIAQASKDTDSLEQIYVRLHEELLQAKLAPDKAEGQTSLLMMVDDIRAYSRKLDFELPS